MDHVFVDLHGVGDLHQRSELDAELVLRRAHLVVMLLGDHAHVGHHREHLRAEVLRRVDRRHREVAALGARPVTEIAHLVFGVGVGGQLDRVDLVAAIERLGGEADVVEHEELGLRTEHGGVADAGLLEIGLRLAGDRARIALIRLVGQGLEHVAEHRERALREERVDHRRGGIRHQLHVQLVDHLPAGDRGAVEHDAVGEGLFVHQPRVHGDVLHLAPRIGEAEVDELDFIVFDLLHYVLSVCHFTPLSFALFDAALPAPCKAAESSFDPAVVLGSLASSVLVRWRRCRSRRCGCARLPPHSTRKSCRRRCGRSSRRR